MNDIEGSLILRNSDYLMYYLCITDHLPKVYKIQIQNSKVQRVGNHRRVGLHKPGMVALHSYPLQFHTQADHISLYSIAKQDLNRSLSTFSNYHYKFAQRI